MKKTLLLVALLSIIGIPSAFSAVTVTAASNGTLISTSKAADGCAAAYTTLGNIVLTEGAASDFPTALTAGSISLVLAPPTGWSFKTSGVSVTYLPSKDITATSISSITSSAITVSISIRACGGINPAAISGDAITISGIQVQAANKNWTAGGNITPSSTGSIVGLTANSTNLGSLSQRVIASAGVDQTICATTATLAGNTVSTGDAGAWTLVGGSGSITSSTTPGSGVTALGVGANTFRWTITDGVNSCANTYDDVIITRENATPTTAAAGADQTVAGGTATLAGNSPSVGSGVWTVVSGSATITSPTSYNSGVTGLGSGTNILRWTISNSCGTSSDDVNILNYCTPSYSSGCASYYINNFSFAGITNNGSGCSNTYQYYTTTTGNVYRGCSSTLTASPSTSTYYWNVWIDYNQDGDFDDAGECVYDGTSFEGSISVSITPPMSATLGTTHMRIRASFSTNLTSASGQSCSSPADNGETEDYLITIADPTTPGTPTASAAVGNTCNSFVAGWSSVSGATSYLLDVSTVNTFAASSFVAGYNGLNVGSVTSYNVTGLSATTTYYYRVRAANCSGTGGSNSSTIQTATNAACYCAVTSSSSTYYITSVTFGGITNPSGASTYSFFSSPIATVSAGCTSALSILESSFSDYIAVFIDYNQDGDFTDAGEYIYNGQSVGNPGVYSATITIPSISSSVLAGTTRMRIIQSTSPVASTGSCTNPGTGEIEDYLITISSTGVAPSAPTANAASNLTCNAFSANWSSVATATSYNLDVATDAAFTSMVGGYGDLSVGNVLTYSVIGLNSGVTYYYRVRAAGCGGTSVSSGTQSATPSSGNAKAYTGATNGSWSTASNWTPSGVPGICDNVTIPSGVTVQILDGTNAKCNNLTITGPSGVLQMQLSVGLGPTGDSLTVYGNLNNGGTLQTYGGGSGFYMGCFLKVYGTTTNSGTMGSATANNALDYWDFKSTVTNSGNFYFNNLNPTTGGRTNIMESDFNNSSSGTVYQNNPTSLYTHTISGNFTNDGTVSYTSLLNLNIQGSFTNNGTINHTGTGVFLLKGTGKSIYTGTSASYSLNTKITIDNGASYTVYNHPILYNMTISSSGTLSLASGSSVILSTYQFTQNGALNFNDGRVEVEEASPTLTNSNFNEGTGTFCYCSGKYYTSVTQNLPASAFSFNNIEVGSTTAASATTLAGSNNIYSLSGNWTSYGNYTAGLSTVEFINTSSSSNQVISGNNSTTFYNLKVARGAVSRKVALGVNTSVSNTLTLTSGVMHLNAKTLSITNSATGAISGGSASAYILSEDTTKTLTQANNAGVLSRNIGTGNSGNTFTYPFGTSDNIYIPFSFKANSNNDYGYVGVATYRTGVSGGTNQNQPYPLNVTNVYYYTGTATDNSLNTVKRFWNITKGGAGAGTTADVTFSYAQSAEKPDNGETGAASPYLRAGRWNGSSWDVPISGQTFTAGGNTASSISTVLVPAVSNFSPWKIDLNIVPLPITLLKFNAELRDKKVDITWSTASETNSSYFTIERSTDATHFEKLARINGSGKSSVTTYYKHTDEAPLSGLSYYRLSQTDFDGKVQYFTPVMIFNPHGSFALRSLPSLATKWISFEGPVDLNHSLIKIFNAFGAEILEGYYNASDKIDLSGFASGLYFVTILSPQGLVGESKFVKTDQ